MTTWLRRGPPRGTPRVGERTRDEHRSRDPISGALMTFVHAGRREKNKHKRDRNPEDRTHRGKGGGGGPKKTIHTMHSRGHTAQKKQAAGERVGAIGARDKKKEPQASDLG